MPRTRGEQSSEREERIKKLLKDGIHVIDLGAGLEHCPVTGQATERNPRDPVDPCQSCGRFGLTGQMV